MNNQLATGKPVYNHGNNNPQSGTRNPTGYINREQKRSGLAAAALRLRDKMQGQQPQQPQELPYPNMQPPSPQPSTFATLMAQQGATVDPAGRISYGNG